MPRALTLASVLSCPHGGAVIATPTSPKVMLGGAPLLTDGDAFQIVGCPFTLPNGKPSPCLTVEWVKVDLKTKAGSGATLSEASVGLCKADTGAPQGTVVVGTSQPTAQTV